MVENIIIYSHSFIQAFIAPDAERGTHSGSTGR